MTDEVDIDAWVAQLRVEGEAAARRRQRWIEQQNTENADLVGVLRDAGESGNVVLDTSTGTRHTGSIRGVGLDVCIVESHRTVILIPIANVASVRSTTNPIGQPSGERGPSVDATLRELLVDRAAERDDIAIVLLGGERVRGRVIGVGHDVVSVRSHGGQSTTHVALTAIAEAVIG